MVKTSLDLPTGVLLLVGMTGCPSETPVAETPSPMPNSEAASQSRCRVAELDDAMQAVELLSECESGVFTFDGNLATCKLEVFYRPDKESEEELVWSITADEIVDEFRYLAETSKTDTHDIHHLLAIAMPTYPPKPNDDIVFGFWVDGGGDGVFGRHSAKAREVFPNSLLAYTGMSGSQGTPPRGSNVTPGQESVILDYEYYWEKQDDSGEGAKIRRDIVRYRVTVTCLDDDKLLDRGASEEEGTEYKTR